MLLRSSATHKQQHNSRRIESPSYQQPPTKQTLPLSVLLFPSTTFSLFIHPRAFFFFLLVLKGGGPGIPGTEPGSAKVRARISYDITGRGRRREGATPGLVLQVAAASDLLSFSFAVYLFIYLSSSPPSPGTGIPSKVK